MKILHTVPALDGGGAERILFDYTIRMLKDNQIDFVVHTETEGILEKELKKKGCKIYHIPPLRKNMKFFFMQLNKIISEGNYDVIHAAGGYRSIIELSIAKYHGIKVRIAHSHMAYIKETWFENIIRKIVTFFVKKIATDLFACGKEAAIWMWGEKLYNKGQIYVMNNAINISQFKFSCEKRAEIRRALGIENKVVIGNIARFSYQKNHEFLIKVFKEFLKICPNAVLILIGGGELKSEIETQIENLHLTKFVYFMGIRNDVCELVNALDYFVLPSRWEGLPVTMVEVQANGLPILASDTITKEIRLNNNVNYLSLDIGAKEWAKFILQSLTQRTVSENLKLKYDIDNVAKNLENFYKDKLQKVRI